MLLREQSTKIDSDQDQKSNLTQSSKTEDTQLRIKNTQFEPIGPASGKVNGSKFSQN